MDVGVLSLVVLAILLIVALTFTGYEIRQEYSRKAATNATACALRTNMLADMWDQQEKFMNLLVEKRNFFRFPVDLTSKSGQQQLKEIRNHMMEELFEAGQHLKNSKQHRATEIKTFNRDEYLEELSDALHLYFELLIASGITLEEIYDAYMKKGRINTQRINDGY